MAITDILENIKREAEIQLRALEQQFEEKEKALKKEDEKLRTEISESMKKKIEEKNAKIKEKAGTLANMERKNLLLRAKRGIIEQALRKAVETLSTSERYKEILVQMLKNVEIRENSEESGVIVVPAKGKEKETQEVIIASGKNYKLSENAAPIHGGFIIKTDTIEIDNSFETIIKKELRGDLEIELHKLLF